MPSIFECYRAPWTLRAIYCTGVNDLEGGGTLDVWIWFVAREGEDFWMAQGLTSQASPDVGDVIRDSIDGFDMDVFISYIGEPWEVIEANPVQHAQMMRDMVEKLERVPSELNRLRALSRSEIEAERQGEEIEIKSRTRSSRN
jgi:hypothetical protein